jgi:hypothetical protein
MNRPATRREVLRAAATGLPFVFGFAALGAGRLFERAANAGDDVPAPAPGAAPAKSPAPAPSATPAWWTQALARMKDESRPGLVLRVPVKKGVAMRLGWRMVEWLDRATGVQGAPFLEAVVVFLSADDLARLVKDAKPDEDAVLVDEAGARVDGRVTSLPKLFESDDEPSGVLGGLLRGPLGTTGEAKDARLVERAAKARPRLPDDVAAALDRMETEGDATLVAANAWRTTSLVLLALRDAEGERAKRLTHVLDLAFEGASRWKPSARLPFGLEVVQGEGGCGGGEFDDDGNPIAVDCGMGRVTPDGREFLKYLGT